MIEQKGLINQLPGEVQTAFDELQITQCLRKSGFKKKFGFPCSKLFQLVFGLVFYHKNWFQLLQSNKSQSLPGKDAVYCFLNHYGYAWRHFLSLLSSSTVMKVYALAKKDAYISLTIRCLIVTVIKQWNYLPIALTMLKVVTVRDFEVDFRMV